MRQIRCQLKKDVAVRWKQIRGVGSGRKEGWPNNREVPTRSTETGSLFFKCQPYRSCNSGESAN